MYVDKYFIKLFSKHNIKQYIFQKGDLRVLHSAVFKSFLYLIGYSSEKVHQYTRLLDTTNF